MSDRTEAIRKLGYSSREAEFLVLAALHSGAFVTRHFTEFAGSDAGKIRDAFTAKLRVKRHVSVHPSANRTAIFCVTKPVFNALGETDNRNRRLGDDLMTRRRMMALDFVLRHPQYSYLATEAEKVFYFRDVLGLPELWLPAREYASKSGRSSTRRCFVEKLPMFVEENGASVVYVDSDGSSRSFQTFLGKFRPLLASMQNARLIFATSVGALISKAESAFRSVRTPRATGPDLLELESAFRERKALEAMPRAQIPAADLTRLIAMRKSPQARYYEQWLADGLAELEAENTAKARGSDLRHVEFSGYVLDADYSFLR